MVIDLGLYLDSTLSMEPHVNRIRSMAFARLHLIARVRRCLRRPDCTLLVKSLVLSHLTYCMPILAGLSKKSILRLQQIVNASIRLFHGLRESVSIDAIMRDERWLPVVNMIMLRILMLTFKVLRSGEPAYLRSLLTEYVPGRNLRSSDQQLLNIPRLRLQSSHWSFRHIAPRLWNDLPPAIRLSLNASAFKTHWFDFLLAR